MNLKEKLDIIEDALRAVEDHPAPDRCNPFGDIPGFYWIWNNSKGVSPTMIRVEYSESQRQQTGTKITLQLPHENISVQYRGESVLLHSFYEDECVLEFDRQPTPVKLSEIDGLAEALRATRDYLAVRLGMSTVSS